MPTMQTKIFSLVYLITNSSTYELTSSSQASYTNKNSPLRCLAWACFAWFCCADVRVHDVRVCCVGKSTTAACCCRCNRQMSADYEKFSNNWIKLNFQQTEQLSECLCINFHALSLSLSRRSLVRIFVCRLNLFCLAFFIAALVFDVNTVQSMNEAEAGTHCSLHLCRFCIIRCHRNLDSNRWQPMPTLIIIMLHQPYDRRAKTHSELSSSLLKRWWKSVSEIISYIGTRSNHVIIVWMRIV